MRWFTDSAYQADEAGYDAMLAEYQRHLAAISPRLPSEVARLATDPDLNLHDAAILEVVVDRTADRVEMALDAADQTVELAFLHGQIVPDDLQALAYAVGARFHTDQWGDATTVVLAQEIDILADGRFVLRLRLWPFHAFAIEFADLELRQSQRRDRRRSPGSVIIR